MAVHPTAIIEKGSALHPTVEVGAYAYVGSRVKAGEECVIMHHATVDGNTTLGRRNRVHPYAYVGGLTQDLKYNGGDPALVIGDENDFREFVTVHCGTTDEIPTRIGSHNHFLSYVHIAHDCQVGSHIVMSNNATLGGHVVVDDYAIIGGFTPVHQFVHIGSYVMVAGGSVLVKDLPPFMMAHGNHAALVGINKVGMERNGFAQEDIEEAFRAFKIFRKPHTFEHLPEYLSADLKKDGKVLKILLDYIGTLKPGTMRGLVTGER
jgi:UDP-N-acetylglucosamine acyltransferase